MAKVI